MCEAHEHNLGGVGRKRVSVPVRSNAASLPKAVGVPVGGGSPTTRQLDVDNASVDAFADQIGRAAREKVAIGVDPSSRLQGVGRRRVERVVPEADPIIATPVARDFIDAEFEVVGREVDGVVPDVVPSAAVEAVSSSVSGRVVEDAGIPLSAVQFLRLLQPESLGSDFDACLAAIRNKEKDNKKGFKKPAVAKAFRDDSISKILKVLGYDAVAADISACIEQLQLLCAEKFTSGDVLALDCEAFYSKVPVFIIRHESSARAVALAEDEAKKRREAEELTAKRQAASRPAVRVVPSESVVIDVKKLLDSRLVELGREAPRFSASRGVSSEERYAWQRRSAASLAKVMGLSYNPCLEQGERIPEWREFANRLVQECLKHLGIDAQAFRNRTDVPFFLKDHL